MKKKFLVLLTALIMVFNLMTSIGAATNINVGDYVQMGTYYGQPVLWRCVDIDENGPLMLSDKIICIKPFDAYGGNTVGSHGRGYYSSDSGYIRHREGSDYWADSNIRCWLNSTATAGNVVWTCGNPPDAEHIVSGFNEYADEAGFLTNFTQSELNTMKTVTQKSILCGFEYSNQFDTNSLKYNESISKVVQNYDTATCEQVTDTVFLLDIKQINKVYNNESILGTDYYIGKPTEECVKNSEYESIDLSPSTSSDYWLRTANASYLGSGVRTVTGGGSISGTYANATGVGVRPAFYLDTASISAFKGAGSTEEPYTLVEITSFTAKRSGTSAKISINVSNVPVGANIYVASYNALGKLLEIQMINVDNGSGVATFSVTDVFNYKAYVWGGLSTLGPSCDEKIIAENKFITE